jgi:hypothetical protein
MEFQDFLESSVPDPAEKNSEKPTYGKTIFGQEEFICYISGRGLNLEFLYQCISSKL